jgi:hypothetical protein
MISFTNRNKIRILCGHVFDYCGNPVPNSTVLLYIKYKSKHCDEVIKKLAYTSTNKQGKFTFPIDIDRFMYCNFIVEAYNPLHKIS